MTENLKNIFTNNAELAAKFSNLSFPTKKTEEWIYTNPSMLFDGIDALEGTEVSVENTGDITFSNGKLIKNKTAFKLTESTSDTEANDAVTLIQEAADSYELVLNKSRSTPIYIHQNYETSDNKNLSASSLNLHVTKNTQLPSLKLSLERT